DHAGTRRWLTPTGRQLAQLPVDPRLARMIVEADRERCLDEVLVIASGLSILDPRERPTGAEAQAAELHARFVTPGSDLLAYLALWRYLADERRARSSNQFRKLCRQEYLNYLRVREWQDVHAQLRRVCADLGFDRSDTEAKPDAVHRALLAGLLSHVGMFDSQRGDYRGARNARFTIARGSVLARASSRWVMAAELVETNRMWARDVARIRPEWIEQVGPHLVKRTYGDPWWDEQRGAAHCEERVTLYGLPVIPARTIPLHRVDPGMARDLFLREALVEGRWHGRHAFVAHNASVIDEVRALEARTRRPDLLIDDDAIARWYGARIPDRIVTVAHFDRWWKSARKDRPALLDFTVEDLLADDATPIDDAAFPVSWTVGDLTLSLEYELDPTDLSDGVVVIVPVEVLNRIDPVPFTWHIPGYRTELVTALVRSLPKPIRRELVPVPDTVREVLDQLDPTDGTLLDALRQQLSRRAGVAISHDDFDTTRLPPHLHVTFRVIDANGAALADGEDLRALQDLLRPEVGAAIVEAVGPIERTGMRAWELGELPRILSTTTSGDARVSGFPALVDEGDSLGVRVLATADEQADAMWDGARRLVQLQVTIPNRAFDDAVGTDARLALAISPYASHTQLRDDCVVAAIDAIIDDSGGPPWDATAADQLVRRARVELAERLATLGAQADELLVLHSALRIRLEELGAPRLAAAVTDIHAQLDRLFYQGVFSGIGVDRIPDLIRYLRAIERRLDRLPEAPDRDLANLRACQQVEHAYDALLEVVAPSAEIEDLGWELEELRVALFAQVLGTPRPVSAKRLVARIAHLRERR
ncbi:MAG: ATP-dependent RNA helicase HrpA, partial [Acidimicrobiales bacterium]|nr:ATP-dependent RNA helicase HrpA [Acidimicrobiales bacterium]